MDPIISLCNAAQQKDDEKFWDMLKKLGLSLDSKEKELTGKQLLKTVMSKWMEASETVMEMMILHLPSPIEAQKYRAEYLYKGPKDDRYCKAIKECDPNGPIMIYISKMVPTPDKSRFYAFGRIFSGKITSGQKIKVLGPNYEQGHKTDMYEKNI